MSGVKKYFQFLWMIILLVSCANNTNVKQKINNRQVVFQIYGEIGSDEDVEPQDSLITQKYGFVVKRVAYCEIDYLIETKAKQNNRKADKIMQEKYGKDWVKNFEEQTYMHLSIPFVTDNIQKR